MSRIKFLGLAAIAAFAIAPGAPRAAAQINFYIGAAPDCPYGYYDYAPHNCAPDGYYGPEWFRGGVFTWRWCRGFMGPTTFKAWSITHSIHSMAITAHCPRLAISQQRSGEPQGYSTEMKCAMGTVTFARNATTATS